MQIVADLISSSDNKEREKKEYRTKVLMRTLLIISSIVKLIYHIIAGIEIFNKKII